MAVAVGAEEPQVSLQRIRQYYLSVSSRPFWLFRPAHIHLCQSSLIHKSSFRHATLAFVVKNFLFFSRFYHFFQLLVNLFFCFLLLPAAMGEVGELLKATRALFYKGHARTLPLSNWLHVRCLRFALSFPASQASVSLQTLATPYSGEQRNRTPALFRTIPFSRRLPNLRALLSMRSAIDSNYRPN